jgi:RNA polymerase sigma factor (sigma-70 family)
MMTAEAKQRLATVLATLAREPDDQRAWESFYNELRPFVMAIAYRQLKGNTSFAEDATQETFCRVFQYVNIDALRDPEEFLGYLTAMTKNAANDVLKRAAEIAVGLVPEEALRGRQGLTPNQESRIREQLITVLGGVGEKDSRIVDLLMEGRSITEIARQLDITYSAAAVRIHRLRQELRKLLKN